MSVTHEQAPPGLAPGPGYSHVASGTGRLVFVAGQVSLDALGALVGPGDVVRQAEQVSENVGLALAAAGATFADLVKLNIYVLDIAALPAVRPVRDRYVNTTAPPVSTALQGAALARPEVLID